MNQPAEEIIEFIVSEIVRRPGIYITEDTALVSSGLVDSLALVDILMKLESVTGLRIPAGQVKAEDLDTVNRMFVTANRFKPPSE